MVKVFPVFREFGRRSLGSAQGRAGLGPRCRPGHSGQHMLVPRAGGRGTSTASQRAGWWPGPRLAFPEILHPWPFLSAAQVAARQMRHGEGDRQTSTPPWALPSGTRGHLRPLPPLPSPEPTPDNQMVVIISVASVLLFLFVTSILLCFILGQHWRQRRMGAYGVQDA